MLCALSVSSAASSNVVGFGIGLEIERGFGIEVVEAAVIFGTRTGFLGTTSSGRPRIASQHRQTANDQNRYCSCFFHRFL